MMGFLQNCPVAKRLKKENAAGRFALIKISRTATESIPG
jgi:hypothetical protein